MRKIVNATYMTLDGDIANMEAWHFDYFGDDAIRAAQEQLQASDALIMGRETYEGFYPAWSAQEGTNDFADRMNSIKKYAVSTTLAEPEWTNTEVISENVVERVRELKNQDGANILQYGFGDVTRLLLANGLLDEFRIWLHPVLSGKATPDQLIYRDMGQQRFQLSGTDVHESGVIILTYTPVEAA